MDLAKFRYFGRFRRYFANGLRPRSVSDNQLSFLLRKAIQDKSSDASIGDLLCQISDRLHHFRPKAVANVLLHLSRIDSNIPPNVQLRIALAERFRTCSLSDNNLSRTDLATTISALSSLDSPECHEILLSALNRVAEMAHRFDQRELSACVKALSKAGAYRDGWTDLMNRARQLVPELSVSYLISIAIAVSSSPNDEDVLRLLLQRLTARELRLEADSISAILCGIPAHKLPDKIMDKFVALISRVGSHANPPALPNLIRVLHSAGYTQDTRVMKLLIRRSDSIMDRLNAIDVAMILATAPNLTVYQARRFASRVKYHQESFTPAMLSVSIPPLLKILYHDDEGCSVLNSIAQYISRFVPSSSARELSLLANAFYSLQGPNTTELFISICNRALILCPIMNSQDVSMISRACQSALGEQCSPALLESLTTRAAQIADTLNEHHVSNVLWSVARATRPPREGDLSVVHDRAVAIAGTFTSEGIVNCLHAFSKISSLRNPASIAIFKKIALLRIADFRPGEITAMLSSLSACNELDQQFAGATIDPLMYLIPEMSSEERVVTVWAFISSGHDHLPLFSLIIASLESHIPQMEPKVLSNLVWAGAFGSIPDLVRLAPSMANRAVDLSSSSSCAQMTSIMLWSLAVLDSDDIPPETMRSLWQNMLNMISDLDMYPSDRLDFLLSQIWLSSLWTEIRFPNLLSSINQDQLPDLLLKSRESMTKVPCPLVSAKEQLFQQDVTSVVRKVVGDRNCLVEVQCPATGYLIDIVCDECSDGNKRIAIEVDGPTHFIGTRLTGASLLKTRLLENAGWKVVRVSYLDWRRPGQNPSLFIKTCIENGQSKK
uniref:RAP domain-containing protein n=1 Tax=Spongospora subterranea TaxID=70186 RepID=A0A0H5QMS7_9EUKA|eukprot:CRZ03480.1 hypothetical protein [Spongospora subterranea]